MKTLILGIGSAQVDAIEYFRAEGHEVLGVANRRTAVANLLDRFSEIDICDASAVGDYAAAQEVELVCSVGSDLALPTIGHVANRLDLPCHLSEDLARIMIHKGKLRALLDRHGISQPKWSVIENPNAAAAFSQFPAVLKPVDSQGQRGVAVVANPQDAEANLEACLAHSRSRTAIVESYVSGVEVSVNVFVQRGRVVCRFISDRNTLANFPGGVPAGHVVPSSLDEETSAHVVELVDDCVAALGIQEGPVYFQLKCDAGHPYVIEVTPRLDGCHLWRLLRAAYGVDLLELTFMSLLGASSAVPEARELDQPMRLEFFRQPPGVPFEPQAVEADALFHRWYYQPDQLVLPINGQIEKTGYQIVRGRR